MHSHNRCGILKKWAKTCIFVHKCVTYIIQLNCLRTNTGIIIVWCCKVLEISHLISHVSKFSPDSKIHLWQVCWGGDFLFHKIAFFISDYTKFCFIIKITRKFHYTYCKSVNVSDNCNIRRYCLSIYDYS